MWIVAIGVSNVKTLALMTRQELPTSAVMSVAPHSDNLPSGDGNIALAQLIREYVDIGGVLEHQICLFPSGGDIDQMLLFHQLSLDPGSVGLIG